MIKVLVVEDSATAREFLVHILSSAPEIKVVGTAADGIQAIDAVEALKPDVVTMDINMPKMDGLEATRRIMETNPTRIIIVTGNTISDEVMATFKSLELGALALIPRPEGVEHENYRETSERLIETIKLMSEVKVVRRWRRKMPSSGPTPVTTAPQILNPQTVEVVAICASTGGPAVLNTIFTHLPKHFPVPILVVQHIALGFASGFADWLGASAGIPVKIPSAGDPLLPGTIYIAPDDVQMGVDQQRHITLLRGLAVGGLKPSANYLFQSVAKIYKSNAVGVILTGMGRDGADGLKSMKNEGALTIAQDKETAIIHSMPDEAIKIGAVDFILSPEKIAETLARVTAQRIPLSNEASGNG